MIKMYIHTKDGFILAIMDESHWDEFIDWLHERRGGYYWQFANETRVAWTDIKHVHLGKL